MDFDTFTQIHAQQLSSSSVPQLYWQTLFDKIITERYDAGELFQMQQVVTSEDDEEDIRWHWRIINGSSNTIKLDDAKHIYLIDHAWTYKVNETRAALEQAPGLLERMAGLMDIHDNELSRDELVNRVLESVWRYNQTYRFGHLSMDTDGGMPLWYVMDEFGSRIQHSDQPTCKVAPFFFAGTGLAYSLMWPIQEIESQGELTRDYVDGTTDPEKRRARLLPWIEDDLTTVDFIQREPSIEFFESHKENETLPDEDFEFSGLPKDRNIKVFIEYELFAQHLTDPRFEVVENSDEADVLWYMRHFHEFLELSHAKPHCLINQFPCENVLTLKDMMAAVARRTDQSSTSTDLIPVSGPKWLPVTYNLQTELTQFVSYFQHRERKGLDNHWICKPWNLARGMDIQITKDLGHIMRIPDSGPKVACKYIEDPVLFYREDVAGWVKFDIRYLVLLTSADPLKAYAYQVFFLRFANKPFSLDYLDDYEKHFTVMNYTEDAENKLKQVHYDEFIPEFEKQYPGHVWVDVQNEIFLMLKELFTAATSLPPPQGIGPSPQSRAMYAVDLMLAWDTKPSGEKYMQPKVCEVNFSPDCNRACQYHPTFANDIFSCLFLEDTEEKHVVPL